jgi:hypothetical protein
MSDEPSKRFATPAVGLFGALGLAIGLAADKVVDFAFGAYDRYAGYNYEEYKKKQENLKSLLDYWNSNTGTDSKSIYLSLYVKSSLVDAASVCPLIAFAMSNDPEKKIARVGYVIWQGVHL